MRCEKTRERPTHVEESLEARRRSDLHRLVEQRSSHLKRLLVESTQNGERILIGDVREDSSKDLERKSERLARREEEKKA
mgnify:CR=1 FL=1